MVTKGAMMTGPARARRALRRARVVSLALALSMGGCSFMRVRPPPPPTTWPDPVLPESSELPCTPTLGPPILDSVVSVGFGTIAFVERNASHYDPATGAYVADVPGRSIAAGFGLASIVAAASAIYGYVETSRCRRYKALFHGP
jgi:hypothetical protein